MPKRTFRDLCELHNITKEQLTYAKNKGVNIYDDAAMMAHLKGRGGQGVTGIDKAARAAEIAKGAEQSLEDIEREIRTATDRATAQLAHEKLKGLKIAAEVRVRSGELIAKGQVRDEIMQCVSAIRGELMRMPSEYAGRLAGLSEAKVQKELQAGVRTILETLSDETNKLFP